MAELFGESGQSSNLALSPPNLQGIYIPGIDNPQMADGLGLVIPWGSGGTARKYQDYGPSSAGSSSDTQLRDMTSYFLPGGGEGVSYNFEGLAGPIGPAGPAGLPGLPGASFGLIAPTGILGLDDTLNQMADLGTAQDRMIYTSAYTQYDTFSWTQRTPTGTSTKVWDGVASDSDGSFLIVGETDIYTSDDSGVTWTKRQPGGANPSIWDAVASDSDGSNLIVGSRSVAIGRLYTSDDSGATWTERQPAGDVVTTWRGVASDSDGSNLIACETGAGGGGGRLYTSDDSGATWTERQPAGDVNLVWRKVASDSDGSVLAATTSFGPVYMSFDSGVTWASKQPGGASNSWFGLAMDGDGSNVIVAAYIGRVYTSADSGTTWTERQPIGAVDESWQAAASDSDGSHLIVGGGTTKLWLSTDFGVTWTAQQSLVWTGTQTWNCLAVDSDGSNWIVGQNIGYLYTGVTATSYSLPTWAEATITSFARTLVDDATAAEAATTLGLGTGGSPTFTGLTLSGLTATRLAQTDGSKALASVADLTSWVAGTANEINIADDGDGTITIGIVDPLIVGKGGSGAATFTDGGILLGSGTAAFTALGQAANGQLPIGSTGVDPVLASLTGTANRITVTDGAGSITLSGPQDIHTAASPTFAGLNLTGITDGNIPYMAAAGFADSPLSTDGTSVELGGSSFTSKLNITGGVNDNHAIRLISGNSGHGVYIGNFLDTAYIYTNAKYIGGWTTDDVGEASWGLEWGSGTDTFKLRRAPAGSTTFVNLLTVDNVGALTAADLTLSAPVNIYGLNHDSFTGFVTNEHIDHSGVSITAGTGMSGGGDITASRTLNCSITQYTDEMVDDRVAVLIQNGTGLSWTYDDVANTLTGNVSITQYTDELAQDAVGTILTDSSSVDFTYDDALNTITAAVLPAGVDHDSLLNFAAGEHFLQTAITNVSSALATGLLKVTTGTGALSVITDSSTNWDTAYTHSQVAGGDSVHVSVAENSNWDAAYTHVSSTGADHSYIDQSVVIAANPTFATLTLLNAGDAYVMLRNSDNTDADGGRIDRIYATGYTAAGALHTLGTLRFSHFGSGADQNGRFDISLNSGGGSVDDNFSFRYRGLFINEMASAQGSVAGYGQLWIQSTTPNTLMFTNDAGADFQIGGLGAAGVSKTTAQTITTATWTKVQFETEDYDLRNEYDNATNYRFTAAGGGRYLVTALININSVVSGSLVYAAVKKNGAFYGISPPAHGSATAAGGQSITAVLNLNTNDYIEIWVYHTVGSDRNVAGNGESFVTYAQI